MRPYWNPDDSDGTPGERCYKMRTYGLTSRVWLWKGQWWWEVNAGHQDEPEAESMEAAMVAAERKVLSLLESEARRLREGLRE